MAIRATGESRRQQIGWLPAEVTSFVGRRHEVAEVKTLLSASRTVTLIGVGGVGKTRLALRVGLEVRRAFRDGVWLVELASLEDPELLAQVVAEALEIRDHTVCTPLQVLVGHLRDKQTLVILDNCEHLVHECAVVADTLLRAAPELRILATSRQTLGISGEQMLPVPTLPLPDSDRPRMPAETLMQCDGVRLFTERARAVLPTFAVTEDNRDLVLRICRRLDGLPLAIELAAVRLRALSLQQLHDRLDDRFRLLTAGSRATLPRHQTLRAMIDWSFGLCSEREQLMWERASVFAGTLDLEAAEAVCSGDGISREEVIDLVMGLVDKSVFLREEHGRGVRYRLLDTVRQYGRERLTASGQEPALQRRHRAYYRALAARAHAELFGPSQVTWFDRLQLEHANLRTAIDSFYGDPAEVRVGLGMAADLLYHWITSYYLGEGRRWLDRGLALDTEPSEVRARGLWANSWLAIIQADITAAAAMLEESRILGERLGDELVRGYVALYSGMIAMYRGDTEAAIGLYEEAVALHRNTENPVGLALALIRLSLAHSYLGDSSQAISLGDDCLAVCDAYGEGWHKAYTMMALGVEVWRQGDVRRATELEKESLVFNRSLDDPLGVGVNLEVLAWIAETEQHYPRAARLLGILKTVWNSIGAPLSGYGHLVRYHDECERRTRAALGDAAFDAEVWRGARLSYEEALGYALQEEPPQDEKAAKGEPARLTRRETEIAQLVAQGMTNKQIAAALVIAPRTAEGHIEHILNKLGFNSRAQIAVWVGDRARAAADGEPPD
ncbi:ATP-binding protein [Nonomuraea aurantiaca]|uniref:ATP-binding protein n=1 Tax=Nonomuraea aurantiaca TaxID=2878562 RepID=UPI001CD9466B|nr:LuxR C-terminal-related transcriptional regulator [Nonomuraea aurantiaca]MCA2220703.1 LuxR C-terminal-related transcriptional regulator [Nonomuraea aurantiaca]